MEKNKKPQDNTIIILFNSIFGLIFQLIRLFLILILDFVKSRKWRTLEPFFEASFIKSFLGSKDNTSRIIVRDIKKTKVDFNKLENAINNKFKVPIGTDLKTKDVVTISRDEMRQHVLIAGATGEGKTTLMTTKIRHAILHGLPVIIIDPKGDNDDVNKIKQMAAKHGRADKFKLFSLVYPEQSCFFNPLKIGTPEQRKSKLLEAFGLEHEYYGSVAAEHLANLFDILYFLNLGKDLTLATFLRYLSSPNDLGKLDNDLKAMPRSPKLMDMMAKMHSLKSTDRKDLRGLIAHVNAMCLTEFDEILGNYPNSRGEIDFAEGLNNGEIMYFQMNIPGYADFGSRIGKLILQDLKLVTSLIHAGKIKKNYEFGVCFIDEFGSFVTTSFVELQKMIRSTNIGLNLYFQGMADLETISKPLTNQIIGNTKVKIILRQDIDTDVETWSSMAGTEDSEIQSHQVSSDDFSTSKTGLGNVHDGKKMKIDFDVFKNLNVGQAIVINKGSHTQHLIQIWQQDSKSLLEITQKISGKPQLPFLKDVKVLNLS